MWIAETLAHSFLLTAAVELTGSAFLGLRTRRDLLVVFLVNLITNPVVVFCSLFTAIYAPRWLGLATLLLELAAVGTEWLLYRLTLRRVTLPPLVLSLVLNGLSFGAGAVWSHLF